MSISPPPLLRQPSLIDFCVNALRKRIAAKAAGEQLATEAGLMVELGVSRTTVRDAVARLKAEGVIRSLQGKGLIVSSPAARQFVALTPTGDSAEAALRQVFELRHSIEVGAARLAALRRSKDDLAAMDAALLQMSQAGENPLSGARADVAFHSAVASATGNPLYLQLFEFVQQRMLEARQLAWQNSSALGVGPAPAIAEHQALLHAIAQQDAAGAAAMADRHLRKSAARFGMELRL